jgi:hypothetical protein
VHRTLVSEIDIRPPQSFTGSEAWPRSSS